MKGFFSAENRIFYRLTQLADLVLLSVLWIICCLTVVLFVPATAAMYHTAYKVIRREYGTLVKEFWSNLKQNCKQGLVLSVLFVVTALLIRVLFRFSSLPELSKNVSFAYYCLAWLTTAVLAVMVVYVCPLLSRFRMPLGKLLGNAFLLGVRHFPVTLVGLLILLAAVVGIYFIYILLLVLPALACLILSFPMEKVLRQYMGEASDPDDWYWAEQTIEE